MKIAAASLQMSSAYRAETRHEVKERLHMWVGGDGSRVQQNPPRPAPREETRARISEAGQAAQGADSAPAPGGGDARLQLLISLVEALTGRSVRVFDGRNLSACQDDTPAASPAAGSDAGPAADLPAPAGYGVEYDYHESYSESEQLSFQASGTIRTADGQEIRFQLSLALQRSLQVESDAHLRLGDAAKRQDPLVVNFAGTAAQLTTSRFSFDLDADGQTENLASLAPGSGFLALDRNGDGTINNGSELFGPASGDGFGELAALDEDGNGWIDENDTAYDQLQVWRAGKDGGDAQSLAAAGIGAIALYRVATPFQLNAADNANLGQIRSSGIFLRENGEAGTIQQIDLTV